IRDRNVTGVQTCALPISAITSKMVLWGMGGVKIHECDGVEFLDEKRYGQPCGCPALLAERKDAARDGHGPKPEVSVRFRLAENRSEERRVGKECRAGGRR